MSADTAVPREYSYLPLPHVSLGNAGLGIASYLSSDRSELTAIRNAYVDVGSPYFVGVG